MARRRPWPENADGYRVNAIVAAREIRGIVDDLSDLREYDRATMRMALNELKVLSADIERWLTLAKFGQPEEE
jgi:hypothetical protein